MWGCLGSVQEPPGVANGLHQEEGGGITGGRCRKEFAVIEGISGENLGEIISSKDPEGSHERKYCISGTQRLHGNNSIGQVETFLLPFLFSLGFQR